MKHTILLGAALAISLVTRAFGQSTTFSIQTYPILGNTQVAADFNGDGNLDLAGPGVTGAAVMLNNGNGRAGYCPGESRQARERASPK
jgi:hypothetical protein